jgi:hypothetical protein
MTRQHCFDKLEAENISYRNASFEKSCGALTTPDFSFGAGSVSAMQRAHYTKYGSSKTWVYDPSYKKGVCGRDSIKTSGYNGTSWTGYGSSTCPSVFFPVCKSKLSVYDLHGNATEHVNFLLSENLMAFKESKELGVTEMKDSCFFLTKTTCTRTAAVGVRCSNTSQK